MTGQIANTYESKLVRNWKVFGIIQNLGVRKYGEMEVGGLGRRNRENTLYNSTCLSIMNELLLLYLYSKPRGKTILYKCFPHFFFIYIYIYIHTPII
jgi:hypothetical protein